jgi:hypothetical protein
MMGGALGFGTPTFNPAQSMSWGTGSFGTHTPQQLLQSLQQLLQLEYVQQHQLLQLAPYKLQQLQQIQHLIQLLAQQQFYQPQPHSLQPFLPQGTFPMTSFGAPGGWLTGAQGIQPQVFGGHAGYVM